MKVKSQVTGSQVQVKSSHFLYLVKQSQVLKFATRVRLQSSHVTRVPHLENIELPFGSPWDQNV